MKSGRSSVVLALTLMAVAMPASARNYRVTARITHDGAPLGEPSIVVKQGVPGKVSVTGGDGYRLEVTVGGATGEGLQLDAQLDTRQGSVRTAVVAIPNQPVTVASGDLDLTLTVEPGSG